VHDHALVIHEDPEGGFWAEVPSLPGCYSQGETVDELKDNIREAITGVLKVLREQGRPLRLEPRKRSTQVSGEAAKTSVLDVTIRL
jgi:predicted RNase H-like HicB family nuclease